MDLYIRVLKAKKFIVAAGVTLFALSASTVSAKAQQVISDWSTHHMIFSKPGSEMNAQEYQRLVNNPRYQMQLRRRSPEWNNRFRNIESNYSADRAQFESDMRVLGRRHDTNSGLKRDWAVSIAPAGNGTALDMYPAVYAASYTTASCSDYAVFPVNATGSATQPNLVGLNNLYDTTCNTGTPSTQFAYYVGTAAGGGTTSGGTVNTSPITSEDGTKVAFVANGGRGGAYFFVVTLGATSGNGTIAAPVELNTAASGTGYAVTAELDHGETVTRSSPYIDYTDDIAYVGDNDGYLHQITCVFNPNNLACTPTETTTGGWPVRVVGTGRTAAETLSGPVFDSTSGDVFVGAGNGNLYCENVGLTGGTTPTACGTVNVAESAGNPAGSTSSTSGAIYDAPIIDSVAETVYSQAIYSTRSNTTGTGTGHGTATSYAYAVLMQDSITNFGTATPVGVNVGTVEVASTGTTGHTAPTITLTASNLYDGDFDNSYYNSTAESYSGHLYFCGNATATSTGHTGDLTYDTSPELYSIGFDGNGTMTGSPTAIYGLASNTTAEASGCTPLTESYDPNGNSGAGTDYLFLGVSGYGAPTGTVTCGGDGCVMNFTLPVGGLAVGTTPTAAFSLGGNGRGSSGIVIDNVSTQTGASQIYFSNLQNGDATQVSQAALQ